MEVIKIAKKRISGNEKMSKLNQIRDSYRHLDDRTIEAKQMKALTPTEAKRIEKKRKEIDKIIDHREKQVKKTHKVKP